MQIINQLQAEQNGGSARSRRELDQSQTVTLNLDDHAAGSPNQRVCGRVDGANRRGQMGQ
jgi:hypothetical protein